MMYEIFVQQEIARDKDGGRKLMLNMYDKAKNLPMDTSRGIDWSVMPFQGSPVIGAPVACEAGSRVTPGRAHLEQVAAIQQAGVDLGGCPVLLAHHEDLGGSVARRHRLGGIHLLEQLLERIQQRVVVLRPAEGINDVGGRWTADYKLLQTTRSSAPAFRAARTGGSSRSDTHARSFTQHPSSN